MSQSSDTYHAACFCGKVAFTLSAAPELMAYCHCDSCRHWSAGPISEFTLWKPEYLTIIQGAQHIKSFDKHAAQNKGEVLSDRSWCECCGSHLFTRHPGMGLVDVPAVIIKGLGFTPAFHVHYQETVLPMADGLPKFRDLPEPAGGSGEVMPEC